MPNVYSSSIPKNTQPTQSQGGGLMATALNKMYSPAASNLIAGATKQPVIPAYDPKTMGMSVAPKASTPVKKVTTSTPSGGSQTTEYHAPATSTTPAKKDNSAQVGLLNTQLQQLQSQLKDRQAADAAGYGENEAPQRDAQGNIINKNATYSGGVQNIAQTSQNLANQGTQNIQQGAGALQGVANDPQKAAQEYQQRLLELSTKGNTDVTTAQDEYNQFAKASPIMLANERNNPNVAAEVSVGRGAQLGQTLAGQQAAMSQNVANRLANQGQQITGATAGAQNALTGQGQGITAGQNLASIGTTQTSQGLTGMGTAAGYAAPELGTPGQAYYNPLTGGSSGGISPEIMQSYAQMAASGQVTAVPSSITGNPVLNAQLNEAAKKINPNYNPITSAAQGSVTAGQVANVASMTAAYKSAQNLGSQLNDLIKTTGVNPLDVNLANSAISTIAKNVSDPNYKALSNLVTDLVATYSTILTPGSTTDTARATAASLLDESAKGSSIIATLKNLDEQAKAKIGGQTTNYGENPSVGTGGVSIAGGTWNDIFGE